MNPVPTMAAPVTAFIMRSGGLHIPVALGARALAAVGRQVVAARVARAPHDGVGDHALHLRLVVHGELLVAGPEIEQPARAAGVAAAAAKHLSAGEGADEHEG